MRAPKADKERGTQFMKQRIQLTKFRQEVGLKVGDMMTRKLILANPDTSIESCVKKMLDNKVGTVLVTEKDRLIGIITKLDILRLIPRKLDLSKVKARDIMIRKVKTIRPDVDLYQAIILMRKTKIKKMPVVAEGNKVIGMLHAKDIVKFEPQLFEHIAEAVHIKEESEKLRRLDKWREHRALHGIEPRGSVEGPCEECGNYGMLEENEGRLICPACRDVYGY
ncbi:MAG: hypothetical protein QT01_C0005G0017 [archaeon GW2011_AR6]|nr:MAG: hypothetical protein QT01_C0005G0017 [archaeon GW2011_AR6]HIH17923.1 CBS domain-containing protein [Nanoarchaeota archaeon]